MGKYLIIKDADFSANAVETINPGGNAYFYGITDEQFTTLFNSTASMSSAGFTDKYSQSGLRGLNLVGIRTKISRVGVLTFRKTNFNVVSGVIVDNTMITELFTVNVTESGIVDIMFPNTIVLGENECLAVGKNTDTALFYYGNNTGAQQPFNQFYYYVTPNKTIGQNNGMLGIDFIYR